MDDKIIVSNRTALTTKYGAAGVQTGGVTEREGARVDDVGQLLVGRRPDREADQADGMLGLIGTVGAEEDQPVEGGEPQITIAGLQDSRDRVLRQAVVGRPIIEGELRARRSSDAEASQQQG